jgi:hypothetical protein
VTAKTDFTVETRAGCVVRTFDDRAAAHRWIAASGGLYPDGLQVWAVTTTVTRRRVDERGRFARAPQPAQTGEQPHG